jgi:polysaccharide pyruvyl transferase WcaK-like protein
MLKVFLYDVIPSINRGEAAILYGINNILDSISIGNELAIISRTEDIEADRAAYREIAAKIVHLDSRSDWKMKVGKIQMVAEMFLWHGLNALKINFTPRHPVALEIVRSDLVLYGHDNVVSTAGFSMTILALAIFCRLAEKKLVLAMGSVGPFSGNFKVGLARAVLDRFNLVILRDKPSYDFVKKVLGVRSQVELSIDPAFLMEPNRNHEGDKLVQRFSNNGQRLLLGVSVTWFIAREAYGTGDQERFYREFAGVLTGFLANHQETDVVLIPHGFGPTVRQDDRLHIASLMKQLDNSLRHRIHTFEEPLGSRELKALIGSLALFIGMRTHALIAALSMGVPSIALSVKSRYKTNGIFVDFFGLHQWLTDVREFDQTRFSHLLESAWQNRDETRVKTEEAACRAKTLASGCSQLIGRLLNGHC